METMRSSFPDVQTHWARSFIEGLAQRDILRGYEDGTFRPERAVTRAEFAAILLKALPRPVKRSYVPFVDVPARHWAASAIQKAYETGFLSGYPERRFHPEEPISRAQVWTALVSGLALPIAETVPLMELYQDAAQIPDWARGAIATATASNLIVNYPDLRRLRPQQPATRAEVAASIYQCLVYLNRVPEVPSSTIVRWIQTVSVSHTREFRAVWIATVWNRDFPSQPGLPAQQQQAEFITLLDRVQALNFNAVVLQVRPEGDALYASQLEPWSRWLTGTQGKAPEPLYDPLAFAIAQCHQRGIELHAWFNPYRARTSPQTVNVRPHVAVTQPDVVYPWGNQLWMDPGARVIQDRTYEVIMDVVRRYDIDGVHLDDYFYPYPITGETFPDSKTYAAYKGQGGTLTLGDWRRENVNGLIQRIQAGIRATKPHVKFGISPFGIYRPGQPAQIRGLDAYNELYADSLKWLQQGWVDYLAPQLYWKIDPPAQSFPVLLEWWSNNNPNQRHLYAGTSLERMSATSWDLQETERQIALTRGLRSRQVLGNVFYSMAVLQENRLSVSDRFQSETYRSPALVPPLAWLGNSQPTLPKAVRVSAGTLIWSTATSDVRAWTLYQQQNGQWTLREVLPAAITSVMVPPGTYALCAVNRLAQESLGVLITSR